MRPVAALAALAWLVGGCATVTTGTTQPINIDSDPQGAECTLMREGQTLATVRTPQQPTIKRHAATLQVTCRKDGYEEGRVVLNSRFESSSAGNALVGGIIGMMVDASSGANSKYDSYVLVRMTALGPADKAAARAAPVAASQATAATPPAPKTLSGPWKASSTLVPDRSAGGCARSRGTHSFDLTNDMLTVDSADGRMLSVTVPVDGAIKQSFKGPSGGPSGAATYELVGNARTRDLELVNNTAGCRWKLTPEV